jgi:hypothetical protein
MSETTRDAVRDQVFQRVEKRWKRIHPSSLLGKLFSPLFGSPKVEAIFIVERDDGDVSSMVCGGKAVAAWQYDRGGQKQIDPSNVDPGEAYGKIWFRQIVNFHITPDNQRVILNELEGPGRGRLLRYAVKGDGTDVRLRFRGAATVFGGESLG